MTSEGVFYVSCKTYMKNTIQNVLTIFLMILFSFFKKSAQFRKASKIGLMQQMCAQYRRIDKSLLDVIGLSVKFRRFLNSKCMPNIGT